MPAGCEGKPAPLERTSPDPVEGDPAPAVPARGPIRDLLARIDRHRTTAMAMIGVYLAMIAVAPIATTPLRSDDKINHLVPDKVEGSGFAALIDSLRVIKGEFWPWIEDQGRFFPGSSTWTFAVFSIFRSRVSYKLFLAALALLMIGLAVWAAVRLVGRAAAPVAVVALASCITLRNWFDGMDTFSGVVPLTVCLTLGTLLLLVHGRGAPSAWLAAALWAYALTTYEVAILLAPTLCLIVWATRRSLRRTLPVIVPTAAIAVLVSVLRSRVTEYRGDAYRIDLDPSRAVPTYLRQLLSGLPLAEQWYPGAPGFAVGTSLIAVLLVLVGLPAFALLALAARGDHRVRHPWAAVLLGASCWLLPPLLVGVSRGWQNELPPGEGYVSVVWAYLGVALLAAVGWSALAARASRPGAALAWRAALHVTSAGLGVVCALTVAQSITIATIAQTTSM